MDIPDVIIKKLDVSDSEAKMASLGAETSYATWADDGEIWTLSRVRKGTRHITQLWCSWVSFLITFRAKDAFGWTDRASSGRLADAPSRKRCIRRGFDYSLERFKPPSTSSDLRVCMCCSFRNAPLA